MDTSIFELDKTHLRSSDPVLYLTHTKTGTRLQQSVEEGASAEAVNVSTGKIYERMNVCLVALGEIPAHHNDPEYTKKRERIAGCITEVKNIAIQLHTLFSRTRDYTEDDWVFYRERVKKIEQCFDDGYRGSDKVFCPTEAEVFLQRWTKEEVK